MDLVDVFAAPLDKPPRHSNLHDAPHHGAVRQGGTDSLESSTNTSRVNSSSHPLPREPPLNPWYAPERNLSKVNASGQEWVFFDNPGPSGVNPLIIPSAPELPSSPQTGCPSFGQLFDKPVDGGQLNVNGQWDGSKQVFDMSCLRGSLAAPSSRKCWIAEEFLGPTAASLVDLDNLAPVNPTKTTSVFSSGPECSVSPCNPFQTEPPKLTLNQLGSISSSTNTASLP